MTVSGQAFGVLGTHRKRQKSRERTLQHDIPATQNVTVQDDDLPTITIAPDPDAVLDGEGRPVLVENGDPVDFIVSIDVPLDEDLVITLGSDDDSEATVPATVTIPAGATSVSVPVTPVDDLDVDGDQPLGVANT